MRVESERRAATDGVVHSRGAIIKGALSVMSLYRRVTRRLSLEWCVFHIARKVYVRTHFKNETRRNVYAGKKNKLQTDGVMTERRALHSGAICSR